MRSDPNSFCATEIRRGYLSENLCQVNIYDWAIGRQNIAGTYPRNSDNAKAIKLEVDRVVNGRALKAFGEIIEAVELAIRRLRIPHFDIDLQDREYYVKLGLF